MSWTYLINGYAHARADNILSFYNVAVTWLDGVAVVDNEVTGRRDFVPGYNDTVIDENGNSVKVVQPWIQGEQPVIGMTKYVAEHFGDMEDELRKAHLNLRTLRDGYPKLIAASQKAADAKLEKAKKALVKLESKLAGIEKKIDTLEHKISTYAESQQKRYESRVKNSKVFLDWVRELLDTGVKPANFPSGRPDPKAGTPISELTPTYLRDVEMWENLHATETAKMNAIPQPDEESINAKIREFEMQLLTQNAAKLETEGSITDQTAVVNDCQDASDEIGEDWVNDFNDLIDRHLDVLDACNPEFTTLINYEGSADPTGYNHGGKIPIPAEKGIDAYLHPYLKRGFSDEAEQNVVLV